jgi:hypothetical protein
MKTIFLTAVLYIFTTTHSVYAEKLFSVSSSERGISAFDFNVTETDRSEGYSVLEIPGFQDRTASASRWMMCMYTELAVLRNKEWWASIYTDNTGDIVTIVFPQSNSLDDPAFDDVDLLGTSPQIVPLKALKKFCGLNAT